MGVVCTVGNRVVVSVKARRCSPMPHPPSYSLRQAAHHTGLSVRHLRRLLDRDKIEFAFVRGVRHYPCAHVDDWWRRYQLRGFDRAANLGPYRRRATGADGEQVCPGIGKVDDAPCGNALAQTATGRRSRLCTPCRAALKRRRRS